MLCWALPQPPNSGTAHYSQAELNPLLGRLERTPRHRYQDMNLWLYVDLRTQLHRHCACCRTFISRNKFYLHSPPKPAGCCLTQKRYYMDLSYHHPKALHPHSLKMPILTFEIHQICPFSISLLHPNCTCHSLSPLGSVVILLLCPSLRTSSITPTPSSNVT